MARNLVRFDPFAGWDLLRRELLDDSLVRGSRGKLPTTDVYTDGDKAMIVEAYLPNFDEKDMSVTVDQGALVIQAERREKEEDKAKQYVVRESSSSLYRKIALPEQADEGQISASFDNGVLKITVPLRGGPSPRSISIGSAARPDSSSTGGGTQETSTEPSPDGH